MFLPYLTDLAGRREAETAESDPGAGHWFPNTDVSAACTACPEPRGREPGRGVGRHTKCAASGLLVANHLPGHREEVKCPPQLVI